MTTIAIPINKLDAWPHNVRKTKTSKEEDAQLLASIRANRVLENPLVWGCGSDFDNVILASAYRRCGIDLPWMWWDNRCYRTMKNQFKNCVAEPVRRGIKHNALDDAIHQASHLTLILRYINKEST